jgi:hypothetical protein
MEYLPMLISGPFGGGISIVARVISKSDLQTSDDVGMLICHLLAQDGVSTDIWLHIYL